MFLFNFGKSGYSHILFLKIKRTKIVLVVPCTNMRCVQSFESVFFLIGSLSAAST